MDRRERILTYIHMNMAFMGGFWGAYSVVQWSNLGNAHTTNLIKIVLRFIDGDWLNFALCVGSAVLYFLAFALSAYWSKHSKGDLRYAVIIIEVIALIAVFFFPENLPSYMCLYPCVFATAFQWSIFCGAQGFNCATIFNSNNFRQFSSSFAEVYLNRDDSFRPKMKFYGSTILFYHLGVAYVYIILNVWSTYAIWSGLLPLVTAAMMIQRDRKQLAENAYV